MYVSMQAHYLNRFPGCHVDIDDRSIKCFRNGVFLAGMVKNGNGQWEDMRKERAEKDSLGNVLMILNEKGIMVPKMVVDEGGPKFFSRLDPIPKQTRAYCVSRQGFIVPHEREFDLRRNTGKAMAQVFGGEVPSEMELNDYELKNGPWNVSVSTTSEEKKEGINGKKK